MNRHHTDDKELREAVRAEFGGARSSRLVDEKMKEAYDEILAMPEPAGKPRRGAAVLKWAGGTLGGLAAAFLVLLGVGAANPALAAELPLIGGLFQKYNPESKVAVGTYVGTYEKVAEINSRAEGENAEGLALTVEEGYSDGEYIHLSFTMDAPKPYLEKYYYLWLPLDITLNEKTWDKQAGLALYSGEDRFEGTLALKLKDPVENGAELSLTYANEEMVGFYNFGGDQEQLPGAFSGSLQLTADTSNNREFEDFGSSGDIKITAVEATPSYTKISYEIPFWGEDHGIPMNFPRLYTENGTPIRGTITDETHVSPEDIPIETESFAASYFFDGLPNGTEKIILRFLDANADEDLQTCVYTDESCTSFETRKAGVLGEVTIDLSTKEAVPSETYLDAGLKYAADYQEDFLLLQWHAGFEDILRREGYPRQMDFFDASDLFQNGIAVEMLNYHKDGTVEFYFLNTSLLTKDLGITLTGEDGKPVAAGTLSKDTATDHMLLRGHDSLEEVMAETEEEIREAYGGLDSEEAKEHLESMKEYIRRTEPGKFYSYAKLETLPGRSLKLMDHVTVTLTDPDTDEAVYQNTFRLVRKDI